MKTRPVLTLADCLKISVSAQAEAGKNAWNVAIAILDDGGHLLHIVRLDGATPANAAIALEKGRTAAMSRRSSGKWEEMVACRSWWTAPASAASASRASSPGRTSRSPKRELTRCSARLLDGRQGQE